MLLRDQLTLAGAAMGAWEEALMERGAPVGKGRSLVSQLRGAINGALAGTCTCHAVGVAGGLSTVASMVDDAFFAALVTSYMNLPGAHWGKSLLL